MKYVLMSWYLAFNSNGYVLMTLVNGIGRSGGVRNTIEEQLIAILSAGKYSSDFNAKKSCP